MSIRLFARFRYTLGKIHAMRMFFKTKEQLIEQFSTYSCKNLLVLANKEDWDGYAIFDKPLW